MRDCEKALLGTLLHEPAALARVAHLVQPDSFTCFEHQLICIGIQHAPTLDALAEWLATRGLLRRVGGREYLQHIRDAVPSQANLTRWAELVRAPASF
jgi:replicative DNA helicase